jgi:uncharacterized protein (TIGR02246 family)
MTTTDIEAIRQVVARVQHATQNELVDEFLALFRPDAIWTTGGGKRLFGLEEIAEFTRQVHTTVRDVQRGRPVAPGRLPEHRRPRRLIGHHPIV